jgi:hypothetical protein
MQSFERLLRVARGGTVHLCQLREQQQTSEFDVQWLTEHAHMHTAEQLLMRAMGFQSWASFLCRRQSVTAASIEERQAEWLPLLQQHCLLWQTSKPSGDATSHLVRLTRSHLKEHWGIGLTTSAKQVHKQKHKLYEVDPFRWKFPSKTELPPEDEALEDHLWRMVEAECPAAAAAAQAAPGYTWSPFAPFV